MQRLQEVRRGSSPAILLLLHRGARQHHEHLRWQSPQSRLVTVPITEVGTIDDTVAIASSEEEAAPVRAALTASFTAAKRSSIGMSAVGTSMRANVNALPPLSLVRVLIAIDARKLSTGAPSCLWYAPAACAAAVMNEVLRVPPSALAAPRMS